VGQEAMLTVATKHKAIPAPTPIRHVCKLAFYLTKHHENEKTDTGTSLRSLNLLAPEFDI
jgi:hypothetical protein